MRLKDKTAFIAGATSGIGAAIAKRFAEQGANVIVTGRNQANGVRIAAEIVAAGGKAHFFRMDVTHENEVADTIASVFEQFGPIHILVNNAGPVDLLTSGADKPAHLLATEDFEAVLKSGIYGAFWCSKYAIQTMMQTGGGSIINISSQAATVGLPSVPAYTVAKGGLSSLTRQLAVDYADFNIRVNALVVGLVIHENSQAVVATPERAAAALGRQLLGQFGTPDDVASAALYLASDESKFITGAGINVDGGSLAMSRKAAPQVTTPYTVAKRDDGDKK